MEITKENKCSLIILNALSGEVISKLPNPGNEFISTPSFSPDNNKIVYCKTSSKNQKALFLYDLVSGKEEMILYYSEIFINNPVTDNEYVYYVSSYSGIDNIYAIEISSRKVFQVTNVKAGAYSPALYLDNKKLLFNTVTEHGYLAAEMEINPKVWIPLNKVEKHSINYFEPLIRQEYGKSILDNIPEKKYEVKNYNQFSNLLNFHSWYPWADPDEKNASLSLYSTNLLNTLYTNIGYKYNWNEKAHTISLGAEYAALFPIFDISIEYGNRAAKYTLKNNAEGFYTWREKSINFGAYIPLNLTKDIYSTYLNFGVNSEYIFLSNISKAEYFKDLGSFASISYWMYFFRGYQWIKDLNPEFGQSIKIMYSHSPFKSDYKNNFFSAVGSFYFPGLFKFHSLKLSTGYEHQTYDAYKYSSQIQFARGYDSRDFENIFKGSFNYALPLLYPDLNIFHLMYLKRFSLNTFFDYFTGFQNDNTYLFRSLGAEFTSETGFLSNSNLMVDLILRYSYRIETKDNNFEFYIRIR